MDGDLPARIPAPGKMPLKQVSREVSLIPSQVQRCDLSLLRQERFQLGHPSLRSVRSADDSDEVCLDL